MAGDSPSVGIVILNWNGGDDTLACLESLGRLDYPCFRIVVVDNGSSDGSLGPIRRQFPNVELIENRRNLGFAAGSNVGIRHLMRGGADYLLLLNNDTEVAPDLIQRLVDVAEGEPGIGIVGPRIYYYQSPRVIWSAGGTVGKHGEARHFHVDQPEENSPETIQDVDYVSGCAMLVKRETIEKVGLLDERFFAYFEETEWCARARRAGFRVACVPKARVWHKILPEARGHSRFYLYLMARNRLLYLRCSSAGVRAIFLASLDLLRTALSWSIRPRHREMRPYAGALVHGLVDFVAGRFGSPPADP